jgi:plasmid stabilization system protein ParE
MSRRIILSPDAQADIRSAVRWYQHKETNLSFRFKAELRTSLRRIARYPFEFPRVNDLVRRALMKRFPYLIYFTLNQDRVFVVAILHQHRQQTLRRDFQDFQD